MAILRHVCEDRGECGSKMSSADGSPRTGVEMREENIVGLGETVDEKSSIWETSQG